MVTARDRRDEKISLTGLLDRAFAWLSPSWALRRARAREALRSVEAEAARGPEPRRERHRDQWLREREELRRVVGEVRGR